jgi:uncharacterized protein (DUF433 family)
MLWKVRYCGIPMTINQQLVDSLVQAIASLSPEERLLLDSRLKANAVQQTPGICGGHARIRNTRIPVWTLVSFRQQGADDTELLRNYPGLTAQDLAAAWDYYEHHRLEIENAIAAHNEDAIDD